jgi:kinesin family protein 2/24
MRRGSTEPPTKKSLVERLSPLSQPTVSEDYDDMKDDEYDELEEIMNGDDGGNQVEANGDITPAPVQLSKLDQAVKELFEEEENLLNLHMKSIHENAELLTEEGTLLQSVQGQDYDIDDYATRLGEILDRKLVLVQTVREKLVSFRALLKKEEELSGLW